MYVDRVEKAVRKVSLAGADWMGRAKNSTSSLFEREAEKMGNLGKMCLGVRTDTRHVLFGSAFCVEVRALLRDT